MMQTAIINRRLINGIETTIRMRVDDELRIEIIFLQQDTPSAETLARYVSLAKKIIYQERKR